MRAIIILSVIALSYGAKLERTYLPPSNARTAGGSGSILQTPLASNPTGNAPNVYSQTGNGFQNNEYVPNGNGFAQNGNGFAQNGNGFAQNGNGFAQNGNGFAQNGNEAEYQSDFQTGAQFDNVNFESRPERPRAALERNAAILRQDNSNDGETYSYAYETENGIYAEENGVATNGVEAQGGFSYTGDDGQVYTIRYTAGQNGFVPQGDHLPTPPPVPVEILRALEKNAQDEAAGIYDDGSYNDAKYAGADENNSRFNYQNQNAYTGDEDSVVTNSAFTRTGSSAVAPTYGTPNFANPEASTFGKPDTTSFGTPNYGNDQAIAVDASQAAFAAPTNAGSFGARTRNNFAARTNSAQKEYLPPLTSAQSAAQNAAQRSAQNLAQRTYLPPLAGQRSQGRNGSRRPSFNPRTGYNY